MLRRSEKNFNEFAAAWARARAAPPGGHWLRSPLLRALVDCYLRHLLPSAPLLLVQNVAQLFLPFLMGPLIEFMDNDAPLYMGEPLCNRPNVNPF